MAYDKIVDSSKLDADLTSVADAIRAKGGASVQLPFPAGFISAIDAISTGGSNITMTEIVFEQSAVNGAQAIGIISPYINPDAHTILFRKDIWTRPNNDDNTFMLALFGRSADNGFPPKQQGYIAIRNRQGNSCWFFWNELYDVFINAGDTYIKLEVA